MKPSSKELHDKYAEKLRVAKLELTKLEMYETAINNRWHNPELPNMNKMTEFIIAKGILHYRRDLENQIKNCKLQLNKFWNEMLYDGLITKEEWSTKNN